MVKSVILAAICTIASTPALADWRPHTVSDHLKGNVGVGISAAGTMEDRYGSRPAELTINCADNSTTIYMGRKGLFFGSRSGVSVAYNFDSGTVQRATWSTCDSSDCVGLWNGQGIPLIKSMVGKNILRVTITRTFAEPVYGTFSIGGIEAAMQPVGQKCGWLPKK